MFVYNGDVVEITKLEWHDADLEDYPMMEYAVKNDCGDWEEYEDDDACEIVEDYTGGFSADAASSLFDTAGEVIYGWAATPALGSECDGLGNIEVFVSLTDDPDDPSDWEVWIGNDPAGDPFAYLADFTGTLDTEFENDVEIEADEDVLYIYGTSNSGAEDSIEVRLISTTEVYVGDTCTLSGDCQNIAEGEDSGMLVSLSGATIEVKSCNVETPDELWDPTIDEDMICEVVITVPKDQLRPTLFFGTSSTEDSMSLTITNDDVGSVVNIGGVDVTVVEFGVVGSVAAGTAVETEASMVQCPDQTESCDVSYQTAMVNEIGYSLVVVEGAQSKSNLVLIGGPAVNSMVKDLNIAADDLNGGKIMKVGSKLVAAGYTAEETAAAVDALIAWLQAL
jgi:hypothetical protein